jgi:hypothetical protein
VEPKSSRQWNRCHIWIILLSNSPNFYMYPPLYFNKFITKSIDISTKEALVLPCYTRNKNWNKASSKLWHTQKKKN